MSSWNTIQVTHQGVLLNQGESLIKSFENYSLTIPKLKFGEIGTLHLSNQRMVFCIFESPVAYEIYFSKITQFTPSPHSDFPQCAYYLFTTSENENFSLQFDLSEAGTFASSLYQIKFGNSSSSSQAPVVKKIIRSVNKTKETGSYGIAAVHNFVQKDIESKNQQLSGALSDIQSLKESAEQLLRIAEQLKEKGDDDSANDLNQVLLALGVPNPVSRETSGKSYTRELALQFATSMKPALEKTGGVMSVAEAYCLYNRKLGMNYVSPNDLSEAIAQLNRREMGVKVETIEGVTVIILTNKTYNAILTDILSKFRDDEYMTPLLMSKKTQLPITIAKNYLLHAESDGVLVRDDSMAGLRFFKNIFSTFSLIDF